MIEDGGQHATSKLYLDLCCCISSRPQKVRAFTLRRLRLWDGRGTRRGCHLLRAIKFAHPAVREVTALFLYTRLSHHSGVPSSLYEHHRPTGVRHDCDFWPVWRIPALIGCSRFRCSYLLPTSVLRSPFRYCDQTQATKPLHVCFKWKFAADRQRTTLRWTISEDTVS